MIKAVDEHVKRRRVEGGASSSRASAQSAGPVAQVDFIFKPRSNSDPLLTLRSTHLQYTRFPQLIHL
jgi:hypothetical protein